MERDSNDHRDGFGDPIANRSCEGGHNASQLLVDFGVNTGQSDRPRQIRGRGHQAVPVRELERDEDQMAFQTEFVKIMADMIGRELSTH
jgi:hypothetical protein